jgi:hypothetical protein
MLFAEETMVAIAARIDVSSNCTIARNVDIIGFYCCI